MILKQFMQINSSLRILKMNTQRKLLLDSLPTHPRKIIIALCKKKEYYVVLIDTLKEGKDEN